MHTFDASPGEVKQTSFHEFRTSLVYIGRSQGAPSRTELHSKNVSQKKTLLWGWRDGLVVVNSAFFLVASIQTAAYNCL